MVTSWWVLTIQQISQGLGIQKSESSGRAGSTSIKNIKIMFVKVNSSNYIWKSSMEPTLALLPAFPKMISKEQKIKRKSLNPVENFSFRDFRREFNFELKEDWKAKRRTRERCCSLVLKVPEMIEQQTWLRVLNVILAYMPPL